jgi:hypothetical protein
MLEIPLRFMRTATASVDYLQGNATVSRNQRAPLTPNMLLQEGDQIQLEPDAFVTVRLADGSTVCVQAPFQLQLTQLRRRGRQLAIGTGTAARRPGCIHTGCGHQLGQPTPLLPAPEASSLPTLQEDAQWLELPLPTLTGAQAWHIEVRTDSARHQVLRNGQFTPGVARFAALPDGHYYLQLRAVDGAQAYRLQIATLPSTTTAEALALCPAGVGRERQHAMPIRPQCFAGRPLCVAHRQHSRAGSRRTRSRPAFKATAAAHCAAPGHALGR